MKTDHLWTTLDHGVNCNQCARVIDAGENVVDVVGLFRDQTEPEPYWKTLFYLCPTCEDPNLG